MPADEPTAAGGLASPAAGLLADALATALSLGAIGWALDAQLWVGLDIYPAQFFAAMLGIALALVFIVLPGDRGTKRGAVPWYDWAAAALGFAAVGYLTAEYQRVIDLILMRPPDVVVAGAIVVALMLEGLRRTTGYFLPAITVFFIAYALFGDALPGRLGAQPNDWQKLTAYLALDVNGILGLPLAVVSTIVVTFLIFGQLLNTSGGSRFFTDIAMLTMGRFRGAPAKIAIVGSALFGSISGSAVANVVATGVITIPMIKRGGYPAHKAAAIEAVASTGGQLMPPVMGASAFLIAEFLQIPYAEVILAALVPGLLYYFSLFVQADLESAKLGISRVAEDAIPPARKVLPGLHFLLPFAVLIVALFNFNQPPSIASLIAAVVVVVLALAIGYQGVRPGWRTLAGALRGAGYASLDLIMIAAAAGVVIGVLGISGLGFNLTLTLVQIGQGNLLLLLVLAAGVCIILGMGLPTVGVYVLLAALVAPALIKVGVVPIAAHLYVMYFGMMSMITPPVAIAAFAAAGLAGAEPMKSGWSAVRFGWMAYIVPLLFVSAPSLLLIGDKGAVVLAVATAFAGVWLVSIAIAGYFLRHLTAPFRLAFGIAGLFALTPAGAFPGAGYTDIAGALIGLALVGYEWRAGRLRRALAAAPTGRGD